jgi:hypothetical protein
VSGSHRLCSHGICTLGHWVGSAFPCDHPRLDGSPGLRLTLSDRGIPLSGGWALRPSCDGIPIAHQIDRRQRHCAAGAFRIRTNPPGRTRTSIGNQRGTPAVGRTTKAPPPPSLGVALDGHVRDGTQVRRWPRWGSAPCSRPLPPCGAPPMPRRGTRGSAVSASPGIAPQGRRST